MSYSHLHTDYLKYLKYTILIPRVFRAYEFPIYLYLLISHEFTSYNTRLTLDIRNRKTNLN